MAPAAAAAAAGIRRSDVRKTGIIVTRFIISWRKDGWWDEGSKS